MIRVVVVDDHPALRAGLVSVLRSEPGLAVVGTAASGAELDPVLYRTRPDVVMLDYHLPGEDGLSICFRVKGDVPAPAVLLYSAFTSPSLTIPARVAGADGILDKSAGAHEICDAIRLVSRGLTEFPAPPAGVVQAAETAVDADDVPMLHMLLEHSTPAEIMDRHDIDRRVFCERVQRMLDRLRVPPQATTA